MASSSAGEGSGPKPPLNFVNLPFEVQREIIQHCSTNDLICLSLVSRHFRHLAATELYRNYRIVFPDDDNIGYNADSTVDSLAGGLDTFVTSDYNYAQHLRSISLDTLTTGAKAEDAYSAYLAHLSCGKFMNTLLLLTLRKARALETFNWNIRVELSRPVYKELHNLASLSHLHLRLHAGPSQYESPPPLPNTVSNPAPPATTHVGHPALVPGLPPPIPALMTPPPPPPGDLFAPVSNLSPAALQKPPRSKTAKKATPPKGFPTLSGFRNLKTLAVLDIDSLDIIPELQACVNNCAPTLSELKLSFSTSLASRARKPPDRHDSSDSEIDDVYQPSPPPINGASASIKALRALREKKVQEGVLGKIFGIDSSDDGPRRSSSSKNDDDAEEEDDDDGEGEGEENKKKRRIKNDQEFIEFMKSVTTKVMGELNGTANAEVPQEVSDIIGTAAQKYIEKIKAKKAKEDNANDEVAASSAVALQPGANKPAASGFVVSGTAGQPGTSPEDINVEEPDDHLSVYSEDPQPTDLPASLPPPVPAALSEPPTASSPQSKRQAAEYEKVLAALEEASAAYRAYATYLEGFEAVSKDLTEQIRQWKASGSAAHLEDLKRATSRLLDFARNIQGVHDEVTMHQGRLALSKRYRSDYVRETRGIPLEYLAIHLIPTKASVLARAVDVHALRRITLLNVGNQAPIWSMLHKKHRQAPLALREILTDHVSLVFCRFVAELDELHELFMIEGDVRRVPASFAPKTNVGIDKIRKLVLRRHAGTLRRLMIKSMADRRWDLNEQTVLLLCKQARRLEELACSFSVQAMHTLMQHLAGLVSLRALLVVHMRSDDTCVWVMRETKRFLIDNVSHYPHLKLEYVSIAEDDRVDKLVRVVRKKKKSGEGAEQGKSGSSSKTKKDKAAEAAQKLASFDEQLGEVDVSAVVAAGMAELDVSSSGSEEEGEDFDDEEDSESGADVEGDDDGGHDTDGEVGGGGSGSGGKLQPGQKIEVIEGLQFCDVDESVRIFQKEIVAGRL